MAQTFMPPGPGHWALDRSHFPGGATPISQWLMEEGMEAGMRRVFAEIGTPADSMQARFVNGFMYTRLRPLVGADHPRSKLPPLPILRLVSRLHPAFRARAAAARTILENRSWVSVVEQWDSKIRPDLLAQNLAFQAVDVGQLDDEALSGHVGELLQYCRSNLELHFWLHGYDLGPVARFLHLCIGWGMSAPEVLSALAGSSPSTVAPVRRLVKLRAELERLSVDPVSLADVRNASPVAAALLDEHMNECGNRLVTGYDLHSRTLNEMPGSVLAAIRSAKEPPTLNLDNVNASLRSQVPTASLETFEEALIDARGVMDLRDDNGPMTYEWPAGLLRRALLEMAKRLTERGRLHETQDIFTLTHLEAPNVLLVSGPMAEDLSARSKLWAERAFLQPPATLGPIEPTPPLDVLPEPLPEMIAMVQTALVHLGMVEQRHTDPLVGVGIGTEKYVGRVRRASSAEEAIEQMEPGDVLVVRATSPAFNAILVLAGGVITSDGGALSHAAVLARELGIPAVVGAPGALDLVDGSQVEIDPVAGRVRIID